MTTGERLFRGWTVAVAALVVSACVAVVADPASAAALGMVLASTVAAIITAVAAGATFALVVLRRQPH